MAEQGFVTVDSFLSPELYTLLSQRMKELLLHDELEQAGIGTQQDFRIKEGIRGDSISWLDDMHETEALYLQEMASLMQHLNRGFMLSLSGMEFHFAAYPIGSFYKRHFDQFKERNNRMISAILYLNSEWKPEDAGELRIYHNHQIIDIAPIGNRLVLFRSDLLEHEVLPTNFLRKSITGWFLYRPEGLSFLG
ncbi:MAG: 2OG-Fe(II) oxygenase [Bacteroidota bacterium]|nr:2OG-Fe(II) oxygenase [Bacteroidota bacterium]MDX5430391.1 2OG-Fe(II) oxygenase [Bacteroidota bacterium]MDX5469152.1 2OG-Fe(II) oxygenase [Bacteroidota bacterium]